MGGSSQNGPHLSLRHRVWRSVFRGPVRPRDDTDRKRIVFDHFVLHNRPIRLPAKNIRFTHTWGLGGSSLVLFSLLVATGLLLIFVYEPSPESAYESIAALQREVFFGKLVRNVHYWSANLLIVIVALHLLRVFLTGGFYGRRQFNWVLGVALLLGVLGANFTGYLLPWDQLSYWAITIVTGMIGYVPLAGAWLQGVARSGAEIGATTLVDYYAVHTTVFPAVIIVLMAFHFWRVRKAGGVVVPRSPEEEPEEKPATVLALPNLLVREVSVALALIAFILALSLASDAPLGEPANAGMSPNPAKAPWYFLGFQELLLHFDPVFAVVVIPLLALSGVVLLPYIRYYKDTSGIFMMSRAGRLMCRDSAIAAALATPVLIVADEYLVDFAGPLRGVPPVVSNGLLPSAILAVAWGLFRRRLKKKYAPANNELVQSLFVLLGVAFIILTVTGVFFRGPGMALAWPWSR
jgi:quinol-cytochrome oxidoreductase complex cytochrome b subunit